MSFIKKVKAHLFTGNQCESSAKVLSAVLITLALQGCVVTQERPINADPSAMNPKGKPKYNKTAMDQALTCVDRELASKPDIYRIYVPPEHEAFKDLAQAGVASTREMLLTALSKVAEKSHRVLALNYTEGSDLSGYANLRTNAQGTSQYKFARYALTGGITTGEKRHSTGGKTKSASIGIPKMLSVGAKESEKISASTVGLDLRMMDLETGAFIPGMHSNNQLTIMERGDVGSVFAGVMEKADFDYEVEFGEREGMGPAVRVLVELGIAELIGKLAAIDYQACLDPQGSRFDVKPADVKPHAISTSKLALNTDRGMTPRYSVGEEMRFRITSNDITYGYCFYVDDKKAVTQLYPNRFSSNPLLGRSETIEIPSPVMPFKLHADAPGRDTLMCYSSKHDISKQLSQEIGAALSPLSVGVEQVERLIHRLSSGEVTSTKLDINIGK